MIEIPKELAEAMTAVDAALRRQKAARQRGAALGTEAAEASTRLAVVDQEIERRRGELLADEALEGVAEEARMSAAARAESGKQLAALREERNALVAKIEKGTAGRRALGSLAPEMGEELLAAGRRFLSERRSFVRGLEGEFQKDVGRLTLPRLFKKWSAIAAGIGHPGIAQRLAALRIEPLSQGPILSRGLFWEPGAEKPTRWGDDWRDDAALVEVNASLSPIAAMERRVLPLLRNAADRERTRQLDANLAARDARMAAMPKGFTTQTVVPQPPADSSLPRPPAEGVPYEPPRPGSGEFVRVGGRPPAPRAPHAAARRGQPPQAPIAPIARDPRQLGAAGKEEHAAPARPESAEFVRAGGEA